jgi:hypothetical protein
MFSIGPLQIDLPKMHFCGVLELILLWLLGGEFAGPFMTRVADLLLCKRILSSSSTSWILAGSGTALMLEFNLQRASVRWQEYAWYS